MKPLLTLACLAVFAAISPPAWGQAPPTATAAFATTTLDLTAEGETRITPDMASLNLGVETKADTAQAALAANAVVMQRVVAAVKRAGIPPRDLLTADVGLAPQYVYAVNQPPRLTGYQASNQLTVSVEDLAKLGGVIDTAVDAGATNVGQISFTLANPVAAQNTARVAAMKALQDKAALYAQLAGYHIVRLVNLSEGGGEAGGPRPVMMMAGYRASTAATPIEAGDMTVRIDLSGEFELAH